jgi:hypothetical protein
MKFTAKQSGLFNGLKPIISVANTGEKREYVDAFKVSINATKDGLIAEAHNGNVAAKSVLPASSLDYSFGVDGIITVDSTDLSSTLSSFDKDELLSVELKGNELTFVPTSDPEKFQTSPAEVRQIEMPKAAASFDKEITLNKAALLEATKKVTFAIGFEKFRAEFLYWKLLIDGKKVRAVCGDGGRFPLYDISGDNIVIGSAKPTTFLFYKDQNPAFLKVLGMVEADTVTIQEHTRTGTATDSPSDQFAITIGPVSLTMVGHDPGVSWPDESQFLARKNVYKFVTKSSDWAKEMSGLWATYNEDVRNQNITHFTTMSFDSKKGIVTLKSDNAMKSLRKVKILDSQIDDGGSDTIDFKCVTSVLRDAIAEADGNIQMELLNETKPMVLKYFAGDKVSDGVLNRINSTAGTTEQYIIAFGAYNKKK